VPGRLYDSRLHTDLHFPENREHENREHENREKRKSLTGTNEFSSLRQSRPKTRSGFQLPPPWRASWVI
jgi:hypothetical protein